MDTPGGKGTSLVFSSEAAWDLAAVMVLSIVVFYSFRLYKTFKGGKLSKGNFYMFCAFLVMWAGFLTRFFFALEGIDPVQAYGVSARGITTMIAAVLFLLSLREFSRFWDPSRPPAD
jgi:hypothetical protein